VVDSAVDRSDPARSRLAERLRRLRLHAGLSGEELGRRCGFSQPKVSKVENARQTPSIPDVRAWAEATAASEQEAAELVALAEAVLTQARSWHDELASGVAAKQARVGELEQATRHLRVFQTEFVPGLLQTAEYARGVFTLVQEFGAIDVEAAVAARLARQQLLYDQTRRFEFLVTEAALHWRPGTNTMLAAQMRHIANVAALPHVDVGVLPLDARAVAFHHSFVVHDLHLVTVETASRELHITDPDEVASHVRRFEILWSAALVSEQCAALLNRLHDDFLAIQ
jgi:transcriptional regulator with XRE-family HTH domain